MRALIRDLLELSKAGKAVDDFGPVELGCVLREVRDDLSELIRARGGEVAVAADLPVIWGDRRRIGQLLANLVGNGLKYNRSAAPRVEVGLGGDGRAGSVVVRVADNGIGIDPRHHDRIFHLFRRLHPREEYEGTGAGLAICQKIAEAHGGRIWVESRPGEGSAFLVELPLPPVPIAPPTEAG
jgi:signal transduction histidine kinase